MKAAAFALTSLLLAAGCAGGGTPAAPAGSGKLDPALAAVVADPQSAGGTVLVLVTLAPGTSAASFTPPGLAVSYRFVSTNTVAGAVKVTGLEALAAAPEVVRVEPDGEMKTLSL